MGMQSFRDVAGDCSLKVVNEACVQRKVADVFEVTSLRAGWSFVCPGCDRKRKRERAPAAGWGVGASETGVGIVGRGGS